MTKRTELAGQQFGRWTVVTYAGGRCWVCRCSCGTTRNVSANSLLKGVSNSCGCYRRADTIKRSTTHGMSKTPIHTTWKNIMQRCYNPNNPGYPDYGGRGIKVCDRWHTFENFYADMGAKPEGMSLDRINVDGGYEPDNCRWADKYIQARNKRNSITIEGIELKYLAEELGISYSTLFGRLWRAKHRAEGKTLKTNNNLAE